MKRFCKRKKCDNEFTLTDSRVKTGFVIYCSRRCERMDKGGIRYDEKIFDAVVSDFYGLVNNSSKDLAKRHGITSDQVDYILRKHFSLKQAKKLIQC